MENEEKNLNIDNEINNNINKDAHLNYQYFDNNVNILEKENKKVDDKLIKSKSVNKKINNPKLNYDYGDNVDTEIINQISNSNIKINIRDNLDIINNNKEKENIDMNNDRIVNLEYADIINKDKYLNTTKNYSGLYNEFKRRYNSCENLSKQNNKVNNYYRQSYYKNYMNCIQRNYLTLNSNSLSNNISCNLFEKEIKTPLRYEYENKINNINVNFTENKINSFTPNRYFKSNNNKKNKIDTFISKAKEKILVLENKIQEYEKERISYINQIKVYKNSFKVISDFFTFISNNFIQNFFPKNQIFQLDNENILYMYFKNLEEYISKLNKEVYDYKYKYEKLLEVDSNRPSLSTKNTMNMNKPNKEYRTQNNSFTEFCDKTGNSIYDDDNDNSNNENSNKDNSKYENLEKRVLLLEKELFSKKSDRQNEKKIEGKSEKIRAKSGPKISINKKEIKNIKKLKVDDSETSKNNEIIEKKVNKNNNNTINISKGNSKIKKNFPLTKNKSYKTGKFKKK